MIPQPRIEIVTIVSIADQRTGAVHPIEATVTITDGFIMFQDERREVNEIHSSKYGKQIELLA